ncbi:hypothetical protein [Rhizobium sp. S96]|uniref:hypothetical protein n=1 Tax=Rhizobium sp. S96 TaxID=3055140 RepID=UPI0025AAEC75|nr:hypothetical protein [Rhizobium sp. S96]MDM9620582.1 hypothetical protein [Rhizobium sp. S96]
MAFVLETFGKLQLMDREGNVVAFPEKGLLLLAYLLTSEQGTAYRATLDRFLWGERDRGISDSTLRKLLSRITALQNELGVEVLSLEGSAVSINRAALSSDLLLVGDEPDPFVRLKGLVKLMDQTFLGTASTQSREFRHWLSEREKYHGDLLEDTLRSASQLAQTKEQSRLLRDAAIILFKSGPRDQDTLNLLVQSLDAGEHVASLQSFFEERRNAIAKGLDTLQLKPSEQKPKVAARVSAPFEGSGASGLPLMPGELGITVPRLVLLPPTNQSTHADAASLAASLIEDITIGFCAFNSLQVIAPYSAIQISHHQETQVAFFERHNVNYVLETRINAVSDEVTLFVQLIFFDDSQILWADRFRLTHHSLLRDRKAISRQIALCVSSEIARHEEVRADLQLHPIAYHRYLVGRQHLARLTLPNLRRARGEMRAALSASPDFAPALSSMGRTYSKEWLLTARGDIDLLTQAENLAKKAIEKRSDFADGFREFGVAKLLQGAFDESAEAMEVAENLAPHYADVIADHADTLVHCSRPSMALQKIERAIELNPLSPDPYLWTAAGANYALSEFEAALDYIGRMADPSLADRLAAASWAMLGRQDMARVCVRRVREANPNFDVDKWLAAVPSKEQWQKDLYREGLKKAGF